MNNNFYDILYKKQYKKYNLNNYTREAVIASIITQFFVDIFFSIFFTENNIIKNDIRKVEIPVYYGALTTGLIIGITGQYVDRYVTLILGVVFFSIAANIVSYLIDNNIQLIDNSDLIFDILASIILVYLFDNKAHNDYLNHYFERHCINKKPNSDKSIIDIIIVILVLNTYSGIKDVITNTYSPATTSGASDSR